MVKDMKLARLATFRITSASTPGVYSRFGAIAKDVIQHLPLVLVLIALSVLVMYLPWFMNLSGLHYKPDVLYHNAPGIYLVMLTTTVYLLGLVLSSSENEARTQALIDILPASTWKHLLYKVTAGFILITFWVVFAGIFMGGLSGRGLELFSTLTSGSHRVLGAMEFTSSGTVKFLQFAGAFMTALLTGMLFESLALAAIAGMVIYATLSQLIGSYLMSHQSNVTSLSFLTLGSYIAVLTLLYRPVVRYNRRRHNTSAAEATRASNRISKGMYLHLAGLSFDPPNRHVLRFPAVLAILSTGLIVLVPHSDLFIVGVGFYPMVAAAMGASAWTADERNGARFLTYSLPVTRNQLFWPRIGAITAAALVYGLCLLVVVGAAAVVFGSEQRRDQFLSELDKQGMMMILCVAGAVVTAYLGALFRLFFRSIIITAIVAVVIVLVWGTIALVGSDQLYAWSEGNKTELTIHGLWLALVGLGLPLLCMWITYCRSHLLERPEAVRARVALVLFFLLVVWGGFLLATPPTHLIKIVLG